MTVDVFEKAEKIVRDLRENKKALDAITHPNGTLVFHSEDVPFLDGFSQCIGIHVSLDKEEIEFIKQHRKQRVTELEKELENI